MTLNPIVHIARLALRILTWVVLLLTIGAAYGGHIPPQIWSLPAVLTLALPYLAVLTLLLSVWWLIKGRLIMAGIGAGVLVLCWGPITDVCPLGHSRDAKPGEPTFSVLTYNVLNGLDNENPDATECRSLEYVLRSGADIVCLQEMGAFDKLVVPLLSASLRDSLEATYPYRLFDASRMLTLLSRYPVRRERSLSSNPSTEAFEAYSVNIDGRKLLLFNVHLTSYNLSEADRRIVSDIKGVRSARHSISELRTSVLTKLRTSFPERAALAITLREKIEQAGADAVVICGDFNDVPASWAYRHVKGSDLHDAFTETNFGPKATYNAHRFYFHIDQILYGGSLRALSVERGSLRSSDHYPLTATFAFTAQNNND